MCASTKQFRGSCTNIVVVLVLKKLDLQVSLLTQLKFNIYLCIDELCMAQGQNHVLQKPSFNPNSVSQAKNRPYVFLKRGYYPENTI